MNAATLSEKIATLSPYAVMLATKAATFQTRAAKLSALALVLAVAGCQSDKASTDDRSSERAYVTIHPSGPAAGDLHGREVNVNNDTCIVEAVLVNGNSRRAIRATVVKTSPRGEGPAESTVVVPAGGKTSLGCCRPWTGGSAFYEVKSATYQD